MSVTFRSPKCYGWIPDLPDQRDKWRLPRARRDLPDHVDLRGSFPECFDQGELGSCTAQAIAGALCYDQERQKCKHRIMPSRLFIYYCERVIEQTIAEDSGAMIRDGIKAVAEWGAPDEEKYWPYEIARFADTPPTKAYRSAKFHQALEYERVPQGLDSLRGCLADGFPFVFGFSVYENFETKEAETTGVIGLPRTGESLLGGHAVLAVGFNDADETFICRNSWGPSWGKRGYFTLPFDYVGNNDLADDFWVIRLIEGK